jgi:hypothetical protein
VADVVICSPFVALSAYFIYPADSPMNIDDFESISLAVGLTVLISYMLFIIYDLAKQSKAGRYGYFVLFGALGLGLFGFVAKTVIVHVLNI